MKLLIIGGGGHAKVVADVAITQQKYESIFFVDDQYPKLISVLGFPVVGKFSQIAEIIAQEQITDVFIAIGNNKKRLELFRQVQSLEVNLPNLIHHSAVISQFAVLGQGILAMPNTVVNCSATIGDAVIINTSATVEHDCVLQDGVHISPNAVLAGNVSVGECSWIGIGSCVKEQVNIGQYVIVGAGSVVVKDIENSQKVVGAPARPIEV